MRSLLLGLLAAGFAGAADEADELFLQRIQPVLKRDCLGCHGDGQSLASLDLRTRTGMLKGGSRGAAITPGQGAASLLVRALLGDGVPRMPPTPAPPDREFIDVVRR